MKAGEFTASRLPYSRLVRRMTRLTPTGCGWNARATGWCVAQPTSADP